MCCKIFSSCMFWKKNLEKHHLEGISLNQSLTWDNHHIRTCHHSMFNASSWCCYGSHSLTLPSCESATFLLFSIICDRTDSLAIVLVRYMRSALIRVTQSQCFSLCTPSLNKLAIFVYDIWTTCWWYVHCLARCFCLCPKGTKVICPNLILIT